ncbi:MAG: methyltransferase [Pseudomonadota bacterium]
MGKIAVDDQLDEIYERALAHQAAGNVEAAIADFKHCLELDPLDHGGAAVRLAALGGAPSPDAAPVAYVATLFDQHADEFDDVLVGQLEYKVPTIARERLDKLGLARGFDRFLDLGCGTGLAGEAMEDLCDELVAVDVSEEMVGIAAERGCYDDLYVAEAVNFLASSDEAPFDCIFATDVLPYLGALEAFASGLSRCAKPGALIGFSTETQPDSWMGGADWKVGPHHRYAHNMDYVKAVLEGVAIDVRDVCEITVRLEEGEPVSGHLYLATKRMD